MNEDYPVTFSIDYPDRPLNRLSTAFRVFAIVPIAIVFATLGGNAGGVSLGGAGLLFLPPLLLIVFREKYPRWWFEFNRELLRFSNRLGAYLALMDDHYPSTDEQQSVRLELPQPDPPTQLNRWLPLVKWLLAIPHYIVLLFLYLGAVLAVVAAWFAILISGRYPRALFDYVEGVLRWNNRVVGYAFVLVTDRYPPFRLRP
jgi:hypothetical protein